MVCFIENTFAEIKTIMVCFLRNFLLSITNIDTYFPNCIILYCWVFQILAWWPTASEEAWPWSPMTGDQERANLVQLVVNQ